MQPISVLLTNNALGARGGSETYIRDVALALLQRGHRPVAFSLLLGDVAEELRRATVPVVDDLERLGEAPDVIHGHHHFETLIAALRFPGVPIINFCHGWVPWEELPLRHPSVRRYVAVDEVCVDRLVREEGIAPSQVELLLNFVSLDRFRARSPLPDRPRRALVLSNAATADGYARVITTACQDAQIAVDIVGTGTAAVSKPEALLAGYDLVFAKGRSALEALAVGCATILADAVGAGPLVTPHNCARLRRRNFGIRELTKAHEVAWYRSQIAEYCPDRAASVCERVRSEAAMEPAIDRLLDLYVAAMSTPASSADASRAAADHCCRIAPPLKQAYDVRKRLQAMAIELDLARTSIGSLDGPEAQPAAFAELQIREQALVSELGVLEERLRVSERELASAHDEVRMLRQQLAAFSALPTVRLRDAMLRTPLVGSVVQAGVRRLARLLPH